MDTVPDSLLSGLQQLAAGSFPRRCPACGRSYQDFNEFLMATRPMAMGSGLKAVEEGEAIYVEVYRNCPCGSTLMDLARDRRDESASGRQRRETFDHVVGKLVGFGIEPEEAREQLHAFIRGEKAPLIERLLNDIKGK